MPPKKKKGKKKKKKKDDGELTVDDKYKKTLEEIEVLKDHLAVRKELTRRSQHHTEEWRDQMEDAKRSLDNQHDTHRAVSADMTRQYKTMQTEMGLRIHQLETELARTRAHLDSTEADLKNTKEEKEKMEKDKDFEINELNLTIADMGNQYERILHDALDKLGDKLKDEQDKWADKSTYIQSRNKQTLLEFGLNPLDI